MNILNNICLIWTILKLHFKNSIFSKFELFKIEHFIFTNI
jgi:transposase